MTSPFDFVKHIMMKTPLDVDPTEYKKKEFVVNRVFSMMKDTLFFANEVNQMGDLDWDQRYQFYMSIIPKGYRKYTYEKMEKESDEDILMISDFYMINIIRAKEYASILTEEQLNDIREKMMKGGKYGRTVKSGSTDKNTEA